MTVTSRSRMAAKRRSGSESKHLRRIKALLETAVLAQVRHHLPRELVEQARLLVVADIVEVDEAADDVVLEPLFLVAAFERADQLPSAGAQVLDENLLRDGLMSRDAVMDKLRQETAYFRRIG